MTRSRSAAPARSLASPDPTGGQVHLYNEENEPRTVAVVVESPVTPESDDGRVSSAERMVLPAGGVVRRGLPAVDGHLTVGCHTDDGRSGVRTYGFGPSGQVVFTLRNGSMRLDGEGR